MSNLIKRLNLAAICLLGGVLVAVVAVQVWPRARALAQVGTSADEQWLWPKTLQVYPSHHDDPVKLVKIMKGGEELVPGKYEMPEMKGDVYEVTDAERAWLKDISFKLRSQTSKTIVSVGIALVVPSRRTDLHCGEMPRGVPCGPNPNWCDGGCPMLDDTTANWGLIPPMTKPGLEARYRPAFKGHYGDRVPLEGTEPLQLGPGKEIELTPVGRVDGAGFLEYQMGTSQALLPILFMAGLEEAKGEAPCTKRRSSKWGCAFAEMPKYNFGVAIVYFEDGTIWGNYGYGYARPNPDGIYTRIDMRDSPKVVAPQAAPSH
jgi:hypothetical protein